MGTGGNGSSYLMGRVVFFWGDENVLRPETGGGHTTL